MQTVKYLIVLLICFTSSRAPAQTEFDGHKWEAPYYLPVPKDWTIERFQIPIVFAPEIPYKGIEDIRFTPGWAKVSSEEYWTYTFLWFLDQLPETDAATIEKNLKAYYTGLIRINANSNEKTTTGSTPVITSFKKTATAKGDLETYTGTIGMMDYMQKKPITLNCVVHVKFCKELNKAILFHQLSPKAFTHKNWTELNKLWSAFTCTATNR